MSSKLLDSLRLNIPEVLNNIAVGYSNNALIGTEIFPLVKTKTESVLAPVFGKGHLRIYESERAPRAHARIVASDDISSVTINLEEQTLTKRFDIREIKAAQDNGNLIDIVSTNTKSLIDSLLLRREYLIADMLQTAANFASGMKVDLSGSDQFTHANSSPLVIIQAGIDAMKAKGVTANTISFGFDAWKSFKAHADVITAIFGPYVPGIPNEDKVAELFSTEKNKVTVKVGQSILENSLGVITDIWKDNVVLARVAEGRGDQANQYTASAGYSFQLDNTSGPMVVSGWEDPITKKIFMINATMTMKVAMLMQDALYLIEDTNV